MTYLEQMESNMISNISISKFTLFFGLYFAILIGIYVLIFRKYNKRNGLLLDEIVKNAIRFIGVTTVCIMLLTVGVLCFKVADMLRENRKEEITSIVLGILIISSVVLYYMNYLKKSLKDLEQSDLEQSRKWDELVGEKILLVLLILMALLPIWMIKYFINVYYDKAIFVRSLLETIGISIISIFLLFYLNPVNIREKLFKKNKNSTKDKKVEEKK